MGGDRSPPCYPTTRKPDGAAFRRGAHRCMRSCCGSRPCVVDRSPCVHRAAPSLATGDGRPARTARQCAPRRRLTGHARSTESADARPRVREIKPSRRARGRAYFNVVHDASRPFTVTAAGVRIRDVGTAFEVDAYAAKDRTAHATPRTQVVVVSGSVLFEATHSEPPARLHEDGSVSAPPASAIVTAGQLARLDDQAHATLIEHVDVADWLSWTTGDLVFRDVPLQDAVVELERWYDVDIVVADSALARRHITATFHDETLPQVLRSLALVLHARFERSDHTVTLRSAPQPTARAGGT